MLFNIHEPGFVWPVFYGDQRGREWPLRTEADLAVAKANQHYDWRLYDAVYKKLQSRSPFTREEFMFLSGMRETWLAMDSILKIWLQILKMLPVQRKPVAGLRVTHAKGVAIPREIQREPDLVQAYIDGYEAGYGILAAHKLQMRRKEFISLRTGGGVFASVLENVFDMGKAKAHADRGIIQYPFGQGVDSFAPISSVGLMAKYRALRKLPGLDLN